MTNCHKNPDRRTRMLNNNQRPLPSDSEIVLALLNKGPTLARCIGRSNDLVDIQLPNKNRAQIPDERVLFSANLEPVSNEELKSLSKTLNVSASHMDLYETWKQLQGSGNQYSSKQIARMYFKHKPTVYEVITTVIHLEIKPIYFYKKGSKYCSEEPNKIERKRAEAKSRAERKEAIESLVKCLNSGKLPAPILESHKSLLQHMRGFAIHGDDYNHFREALNILRLIKAGPKNNQEKAWKLMTSIGFVDQDEPIELERDGVRTDFPSKVISQTKLIKKQSLIYDNRRDLTDLFTIAIDNEETRDRDDAISIKMENDDTVLLGIHITDVSSVIPKESPIDLEAKARVASVYLPELTINMLPELLSEGACSFRENEISVAVTVMTKFVSGKLEDWEIFSSLVCPNKIMTYTQADSSLANTNSQHHLEIMTLDNIAKSLRQARQKSGAVLLNRPTLSMTINPDYPLLVDVVRTDTPARMAVAEIMILANSLYAKLCLQKNLSGIYRTQGEIDAEAYETLSPNDLDILGQYQLMRKLPPPQMTTVNGRHCGLGLDQYLQATAPVRRFCDLVMQRQILHSLKSGSGLYSQEELKNIAQVSAAKSKRISSITNERKRYWFLKWLENRRNDGLDEYQAMVLTSNYQGYANLELTEYPFRFKAVLSDLDRPGDLIDLKLNKVDIWNKVPKFVVI